MVARPMPGVLTTLGNDSFVPRFLTDEEVAANAAREQQAKVEMYFKNSDIPIRYKNANIAECVDGIREYAELIKGSSTGPWLLISGANGVGKTYAACAIANAEMGHMTSKFTTVSNIIRTDWNNHSLKDYINPKRLIIDDLGKEKPSIYVLEKIFDILNERDARMKPTIITTNYGRDGMIDYLTVDGNDEYAKALVSRIMSKENKIVTLSGKDKRR